MRSEKRAMCCGLLTILAVAPCFSQYVADGSRGRVSETLRTADGPVTVKYSGIYTDGWLKYPTSVDVSYEGQLAGRAVRVEYSIRIEGKTTLYTCNLSDDKKLSCGCNSDSACKLFVQGQIVTRGSTSQTVLAKLDSVAYTSGQDRWCGWLVAGRSPMGTSDTSRLRRTPFWFDTPTSDFHTDLGTSPVAVPAGSAFFFVGDDFRLSLSSLPSTPCRHP
jgi:hypothetical protein